MRRFVAMAVLTAAATAGADGAPTAPPAALVATGSAIVVAHDQKIDVFNPAGTQVVWSAAGLRLPSFAAGGMRHVAVVDSLNNELRLLDLENRRSIAITMRETPTAAAFVGSSLFVVARDSAELTRYALDGSPSGTLRLSPDPAFLRVVAGMIYVYSRAEGVVQEIEPQRLETIRQVAVLPGASDFEIDDGSGYLAYPRDGKLRTFTRATMTTSGELAVGAVPIDIDLAAGPNAISARRLAVADPSSKRVWMIEGRQSLTQAFLRGFLRGFIGLGAGGGRNATFPTGVDRVVSRGSTSFAYDTSSGTLYRTSGSKTTTAATGVPPAAFGPAGDRLAVWADGRVRLLD